MAFTSLDDLVAQISAGKYLRREHSKVLTPAHTAGGWHMLSPLNGNPGPTTFPSAQDLVFQSCSELGGDAVTAALPGLQHGGNMTAPATKHIVSIGACIVAAAGAPWQVKLVDLCGYYRLAGTNVTGTSGRTLINSNTVTFDSSTGLRGTYTNDFNTYTKVRFTTTGALPVGLSLLTDYWTVRVDATHAKFATSLANAMAGSVIAYTDSGSGTHTMMTYNPRYTNGVGCEACFVVQTQPTAGGPNLTASAYDSTTDTAGAGTRAFQGSVTNGATADAYATRITHSGSAAAGRYGPFLPKQGGDLGIARINSFTWSAGTAYTGSGVIALCIVKPLCDLSIPVTGLWSERDLVQQLPSIPKIEDGACLNFMLYSTGATTNNSPFWGVVDFAWGG
jgi:hypothetical protein